jgi:peptide/nickel transport system substrate-binding protein
MGNLMTTDRKNEMQDRPNESLGSSLLGSNLTRRDFLGRGARFAAFGAVATTASISLVACEDDDSDDDVVDDDPPAATDDEDVDVADDDDVDVADDDQEVDVDDDSDDDAADTPDDDRSGGTFTLIRSADANNLLPGATTGLADIATNFLLYDGLIIHGFDGEIYPLLATDWESDDEGVEWTFTLRDDVTFHSGEQFNAEHVVDHFERWKDRPTSAKIVLLDEVELVDDYTVRFHLTNPTLVFLTMISQTEWAYGGIPNMHKVEELGDDYGVVEVDGTGPYKLEEWQTDDRIILARNEDYTWGPEFYENRGPVYPERLILQVVPEDASRTALIETGEADLNIEVAPRDVSRLEDEPGVTVESFPRVSSNHYSFNMEREIFQDLNVRRAVMYGINREEITEFIMHGQADPAEGYLHPDMVGATDRSETSEIVKYDPDAAVELLEESGWEMGDNGVREKDGEPLTFTVFLESELHEQIAQVVQDHLREIGIDMQINRLESAAYSDALQAGEHDVLFRPMIYSSEDHMYFFHSDFIPSPNASFWSDSEYDDLFNVSQTTTDEDEMYDAFSQMEMRLLEETVVVPIQHQRWIFAWRDGVEGTTFHQIHGIYKMMDFWLDD